MHSVRSHHPIQQRHSDRAQDHPDGARNPPRPPPNPPTPLQIRLLRLGKLLRILRAFRLLEQWETSMVISYKNVSLSTFLIIILISSHWGACAWALVAKLAGEDVETSWVIALEDSKGQSLNNEFTLYMAALHFAIMTLTSVGCVTASHSYYRCRSPHLPPLSPLSQIRRHRPANRRRVPGVYPHHARLHCRPLTPLPLSLPPSPRCVSSSCSSAASSGRTSSAP